MTFEADQGLGLRRQALQVQQLCSVTLIALFTLYLSVFLYLCNGQAARSMARFAVHQRQLRLRFDLFTMNTAPELVRYLVMLVAGGNAIVCAHIFGIHAADDHFLVLIHRQQGIRLLQCRAAKRKQDYEHCGNQCTSHRIFLVRRTKMAEA